MQRVGKKIQIEGCEWNLKRKYSRLFEPVWLNLFDIDMWKYYFLCPWTLILGIDPRVV